MCGASLHSSDFGQATIISNTAAALSACSHFHLLGQLTCSLQLNLWTSSLAKWHLLLVGPCCLHWVIIERVLLFPVILFISVWVGCLSSLLLLLPLSTRAALVCSVACDWCLPGPGSCLFVALSWNAHLPVFLWGKLSPWCRLLCSSRNVLIFLSVFKDSFAGHISLDCQVIVSGHEWCRSMLLVLGLWMKDLCCSESSAFACKSAFSLTAFAIASLLYIFENSIVIWREDLLWLCLFWVLNTFCVWMFICF